MLKRYIGSVAEVSVVIQGTDYGLIKTGESLSVPDEVAENAAWPEDNWEDVTENQDSNNESDEDGK